MKEEKSREMGFCYTSRTYHRYIPSADIDLRGRDKVILDPYDLPCTARAVRVGAV